MGCLSVITRYTVELIRSPPPGGYAADLPSEWGGELAGAPGEVVARGQAADGGVPAGHDQRPGLRVAASEGDTRQQRPSRHPRDGHRDVRRRDKLGQPENVGC